jgi:hypothetical protein
VKTLALSLLLAGGLFAQAINNNPNIVMLPWGAWTVCPTIWGASLPSCRQYVAAPGTETYLLQVRPANASTTVLRYAVTGTRADGTIWNATGLVDREQQTYTSIVLNSGVCVSWVVTITELNSIGVQTGSL